MMISADIEPYWLPYQDACRYARQIQQFIDSQENPKVCSQMETYIERDLSNQDFYFVQNGYSLDFFTKFNIAYLDVPRKRVKRNLVPSLKNDLKYLKDHVDSF